MVDGGEGFIVEEAGKVSVYSTGESRAFVDESGVNLDRVSAAFQGLDKVFGGGEAAAGVDGHGIAHFSANICDDAEGVGKEGFAAEAAAAHLDGGFLHGSGVGGGDAVDAQFMGDADEGEDVFLFSLIVVGRDFD